MIVRAAASALLGAATTFGLFLGMSALVTIGETKLTEPKPPMALDFIRTREPPPPPPDPAKLPEPVPETEPPPPLPEVRSDQVSADPAPVAIDVRAPTVRHRVQMSGALSSGTVQNREAVPVVRTKPLFPSRAEARGIEGHVRLRFTITPSGSVSDIEVLEAEPPGYFERAAIRALGRWRYEPQLVDGAPVARPGQTVTISFDLDEESQQ